MRLLAPLVDVQREKGVLITCNTPEAHRLARSIWGDTVTVRYCPLDYRLCIKRFISRHRPSIIFVVETEIWPELYQQCHHHGIAIYIVNGRISDTTFRSTLARQWIYPPALERVTAVWAREPEDAKRFIEMGCAPDKTHTTGSIKMTRQATRATPEHPLLGIEFSLAVSTHASEELVIAQIGRAHV